MRSSPTRLLGMLVGLLFTNILPIIEVNNKLRESWLDCYCGVGSGVCNQ